MTEFTPTTDQVRDWYATWPTMTTNTRVVPEHLAEFDRWLAQHDAEVRAEAWDEGARAGLDAGLRIAENVHANGGALDLADVPHAPVNPYRKEGTP